MYELLGLIEYLLRGLVRLLAGPRDRRRIADFFEGRGEQVREIRWTPLAAGWMSHWYNRFYEVQYDDVGGIARSAKCRTSWRKDVEITSDQAAD